MPVVPSVWPCLATFDPVQRVFVSNFFLLLLLNLVVKPFYILGIVAEVQNRTGEEAFGVFFALTGLSFLFNIILDLGINNYNTRIVAGDEFVSYDRFAKLLFLRACLAIIYMLILFASGLVLGYDSDANQLLMLLGLGQALSAFVLFFRSNLAGLHLFKHDSIISVLDRFLLVVVMGLLLWGGIAESPFRIEWFVYAQLGAYGLTAVVALIMLVGRKTTLFKVPSFEETKQILSQSLPFALLILLMMFYYRTDGVMLERMLPDGAYQSGLYAKGFTLMEAGNMVTYLFAVILLPVFTRMLKRGEDIGPTLGLSFRWVLSGSWVLVGLCLIFPTEILGLRFSTGVAEAAPVFSLLMVSFLLFSLSYILSTALTARGNMRVLNQLAALGMLLNIVLNFIFIPEYKAVGSAWASVVAHSVVVVGQAVYVLRVFKPELSRGILIKFFFFAIVSGGALWWCRLAPGHWMLLSLVFISVSVLALFATGFLSIRRFMDILRSNP